MVLTTEQAELLQKQLSKMRHDVNNHLAVIMASVELIRHRPEMTASMLDNLAQKPGEIASAIKAFSAEMGRLLAGTRQ